MKEDIKKYVNYFIGWIKKDLKNNMPYLEEAQQMVYLNQQLNLLYLVGILKEDKTLLDNIMDYREEQSKQEVEMETALKPQKQMIDNKNNIFEHLMKEL